MRAYITVQEGSPRRLKITFSNRRPKAISGNYWVTSVSPGRAIDIAVYAAGATIVDFRKPEGKKKAS